MEKMYKYILKIFPFNETSTYKIDAVQEGKSCNFSNVSCFSAYSEFTVVTLPIKYTDHSGSKKAKTFTCTVFVAL